MSLPSAFFARLHGVSDDLEAGLRSLTAKQNELARKGCSRREGVAAQRAETMLEEINAIEEEMRREREATKGDMDNLDDFLSDASKQAEDMMNTVRRMEQWGKQYG